MANTITFTCAARSIALTVTPVPGSWRSGGGHDDRGGGRTPSARAGYGFNGRCLVNMVKTTSTAKQQTLAELLTLVSPEGPGDITITGTGLLAECKSWLALVDVSVTGDSVQQAEITWKGTANPVATTP